MMLWRRCGQHVQLSFTVQIWVPAAKGTSISMVQYKFVCLQGKGKGSPAEIHAIRSHAAVQHNQRRREKQRQLSALAAPTINSLCMCNFTAGLQPPPKVESLSPTTEVAIPRKRSSAVQEKKQRIADSYKICVYCKKLQFVELSRASQTAVLRMMSPHVVAFCQSDFDPFGVLPEYPGHMRPQETRELDEVKFFSESLPRIVRNGLFTCGSRDILRARRCEEIYTAFCHPGPCRVYGPDVLWLCVASRTAGTADEQYGAGDQVAGYTEDQSEVQRSE